MRTLIAMRSRATTLLGAATLVLVGCGETPPPMVRAVGSVARMADGRTVTLLAVGRPEGLREIQPPYAGRGAWRPDGGRIVEWPALAHAAYPPFSLRGGDVRALAFGVSGSGGHEDAIGYVPDGAAPDRGYESPVDGWPFVAFASGVRAGSSRYRLGMAYGPWRVLATRRIDLTRRVDETLLQGPWGRVRHTVPPPSSATKGDLYEETWGYDRVEPKGFPPAYELRSNRVSEGGTGPVAYPTKNGRPTLDRGAPPSYATLVVTARPWHWAEFSGIHYAPNGVR